MHHDHYAAAAALLFAASGAAAQTAAQPPAPAASAPATLGEIRVKAAPDDESATGPVQGYTARRSATGTKTDTPLIETPRSVSVISAERMRAQGAPTVVDALAYSAGVNANIFGHDTRHDWAALRGFDLYSPGFFLDGLQTRNNGTWAFWRFDPYALERVEILRGPASVLYGQGSPGGLVNLVSKRPQAEAQRELQIAAGSFGQREAAGDFTGPLAGDGTLLYRVTGLVHDGGTQVDFIDDRGAFIAPALTWRPSAATTLTLLSHFSTEDTASTQGFLPREGTLAPNPNGRIPVSRFVGEPGYDKYERTQALLGYALEHRFDDVWTLRQNARVGRLDVDYRQLLGGDLDPDDPARRTLLRASFGSDETVRTLGVDNQVQARFATGPLRHTLLIGLDYQRNVFDQVSFFGDAPPLDVYAPVYGQPIPDTPPFADAEFRLRQTGLYLQDQAKLGERWAFVLGGRHDRASIRTDDRLAGATTRQDDEAFSGRAGVVWLGPNGLAPYASYSESFTPVAGFGADGRPFEPETGKQFELGLKWQPPGSRSLLTVAAFEIKRQNYLTTDPGSFIRRQTGEIVSRGLEFEAVAQPLPALDMTAAYTWLPDFEVTRSSDPAEVGQREINAAEHTASLWLHYRFGSGFSMGAGARYVGPMFGELSNTPESKVPGYTLYDAVLGYETGPWQFALNARNLADKVYVSTCGFGTCYYGSVRTLKASATYRF